MIRPGGHRSGGMAAGRVMGLDQILTLVDQIDELG
jgi:hypothetical protein